MRGQLRGGVWWSVVKADAQQPGRLCDFVSLVISIETISITAYNLPHKVIPRSFDRSFSFVIRARLSSTLFVRLSSYKIATSNDHESPSTMHDGVDRDVPDTPGNPRSACKPN